VLTFRKCWVEGGVQILKKSKDPMGMYIYIPNMIPGSYPAQKHIPTTPHWIKPLCFWVTFKTGVEGEFGGGLGGEDFR